MYDECERQRDFSLSHADVGRHPVAQKVMAAVLLRPGIVEWRRPPIQLCACALHLMRWSESLRGALGELIPPDLWCNRIARGPMFGAPEHACVSERRTHTCVENRVTTLAYLAMPAPYSSCCSLGQQNQPSSPIRSEKQAKAAKYQF